MILLFFIFFFFFNDTATTEIYTLSLHDALPICGYYTVKDCVTIDVLPRTPGNNVYVGFMVWSNFTATKCRGLVRPNHETNINIIARRTGKDEIGRAVQQECRDRSRMPSSA